MLSSWQRPEGVALEGVVWARFRGRRAMGDGRVPDFWVQTVRPEDDAQVLRIMEKHFLREEETSRALGLAAAPDVIAEYRAMWQSLLEQRVSLAAWTGWPDGAPRLVACNVLYVRCKDDPAYEAQTPLSRKIMRALYQLDGEVDVFARHGVAAYLSAMGLSALPDFRGQALGLELLRARRPLCRALRLRVTATIFTGAASQKQAQRAGFSTLASLPYARYVDDGELPFASVKGVDAMQLQEMVVPEQDDGR
ncbi:hypothetical protein R5R35_003669 [Gryllus longicercus]|uniref:N-acetyltransferase domain-containing protein n=1 Tax=Gryllus longicercus TaxID=2509291 RepID=A0AAN9VVH4_9ORTH